MNFSIIIPTHNREKTIKRTLDSVISQSYTKWECLVVDDGSKDRTIEVVTLYSKKEKRIKLIRRDSLPKGANKCRNIGYENAIGDYLIFLDSDDELKENSLERRCNDLIETKFDFIVYPMQTNQNGEVKLQPIPNSKSYIIDFLSYRFHWGIMCVTWKKDFLEKKLNYIFLEKLPRFNDVDLSIRAMLSSSNYKVFYNAKPDSVYNIYEKKNLAEFSKNVVISMEMFIPQIVNTLNEKNKKEHLPFLINFLHAWLKFFYFPSQSSKLKDTIKILNLLKREKIINGFSFFIYFSALCNYSFFLFFKNRFQKILMIKSQKI